MPRLARSIRNLLLLVLLAVPAAAQLVTVTASNILDRGAPLASGTYCATPMGAAGRGFHVGSTGNVTGSPVCRDVVNGAIATTLGGVAAGPLQLADTSLTAPLNVDYGITIRDANGAYVLGGPLSGYIAVQPAASNSWCTAGVCNWDLYLPTIPNLTLSAPLIWGQLGGTLSNQADLWGALGAKTGIHGAVTLGNCASWFNATTLQDAGSPCGSGSGTQIQSDWDEVNNLLLDYIKNKPSIPAAQVQTDWNASSGMGVLLNKPTLATVATSGSYADLSSKPTIPAAQIQSDWNEANTALLDYIKNKPSIPAAQVQTDWNASTGMGVLLNKPTLATVATSGSYNDLSNQPTIPTASSATPNMDGTGAAGSSGTFARGDHTHPTDTSRQAALGFTPESVANKSTDGTFAANSDTNYPSQKAAKTYISTHGQTDGQGIGPNYIAGMLRPNVRKPFQFTMASGGGSLAGFGFSFVVEGTASAIASTSTMPFLVNYVTAASTGSEGGVVAGTTSVFLTTNPMMTAAMMLPASGDLTNVIAWVALNGGTNAAGNALHPAANIVGFRFVAGTDTYWTCSSATSASLYTDVATSYAPTAGVLYKFNVIFDSATPGVIFQMCSSADAGGSACVPQPVCGGEMTTHIPATSAATGPYQVVWSQSNAPQNIRIAWSTMETDF